MSLMEFIGDQTYFCMLLPFVAFAIPLTATPTQIPVFGVTFRLKLGMSFIFMFWLLVALHPFLLDTKSVAVPDAFAEMELLSLEKTSPLELLQDRSLLLSINPGMLDVALIGYDVLVHIEVGASMEIVGCPI